MPPETAAFTGATRRSRTSQRTSASSGRRAGGEIRAIDGMPASEDGDGVRGRYL